jgi:hypothetical protein
MVLFQFLMAIDAGIYGTYKTILYVSYEYILMLIHGYIISAFISRRDIVRAMGIISSAFRGIVNSYVYNLVFWYNMGINHETNS